MGADVRDTLLVLQRTAGNRATSEALASGGLTTLGRRTTHDPAAARAGAAPVGSSPRLVVQRAPLTLAPVISADDTLTAVVQAVNQYNALGDDDRTRRVEQLAVVDRAIYVWFKDHPSPTLEDPKRKALQALLDASNAEHRAIVRAARSDPSLLPVPVAGRTEAEVAQIRQLWQKLVAAPPAATIRPEAGEEKVGSGGLQVMGSTAFVEETLTSLAKLLALPTGEEIIGYLTRAGEGLADEEKVIILAKLPQAYAAIEAGHRSESSYAMSQKIAAGDTKDTRHFLAEVSGDVAGAPAVAGPEQFRQAVTGGARGMQATFGGAGGSYQFGEGAGAVVKMSPKPAEGAEAGLHMAGARPGEAVINPTHITLGHELGHAAKIRAGALTESRPGVGAELLEQAVPTEKERNKWGGRIEEYVNIEGVENPLRRQAGMPERKYHKPFETLQTMERWEDVNRRLGQLTLRDPDIGDWPLFTALSGELLKQKEQVGQDAVYNDVTARITALAARIPGDLVTWKKQRVEQLRDEVGTAYASFVEAWSTKYAAAKKKKQQQEQLWAVKQKVQATYFSLMHDIDAVAALGQETRTHRMQLRAAKQEIQAQTPH